MRGARWVMVWLLGSGCLSVPAGSGDDAGAGGIGPVDLAPISAIAAGRRQVCAVGAGGHVACWGDTTFLDIQDQPGGASTPALVRDAEGAPLVGATAVAVGYQSACALLDGAAWCWGANDTGQLGRGELSESGVLFPPGEVTGLSGITALTIGGSHACARVSDQLSCWGRDGDGELGDGVAGASSTAPQPIGGGIAIAVAGGHHTCVSAADGTRCAGDGGFGQNAQLADSAILSSVGLGVAESIGASEYHTCVLVDRQAWCWGRNSSGELGDGMPTPDPQPAPTQVDGLAGCEPTAIDAEGAISCASCGDGTVRCWGAGGGGRLGIGSSPASQLVPTEVVGLAGRFVKQIALGSLGGCALDTDGQVRCWGSNERGELGTGRSAVDVPFATAATDPIDFSAVE